MRVGAGPFGENKRPWYRLYPGRAAVVAIALFVGISVLLWFNDGSGHAVVVLYVLPIALLAVTFGLWGGLGAATVGFVVFALFEIFHSSGDIDADGWAARAIAMFLLGVLLGRATDQTIASEQAALNEQQRRYELEDVNHRYAEAIEISDSILQQMVAAKWMVERGRSDQAAEALTATIERSEEMVTALLPVRVSVPVGSQAELPLLLRPTRGEQDRGEA